MPTKRYPNTSYGLSPDAEMSTDSHTTREGLLNVPSRRIGPLLLQNAETETKLPPLLLKNALTATKPPPLLLKNPEIETKLPPLLLKNAETATKPPLPGNSVPTTAAPRHDLLLTSDDFHFTF